MSTAFIEKELYSEKKNGISNFLKQHKEVSCAVILALIFGLLGGVGKAGETIGAVAGFYLVRAFPMYGYVLGYLLVSEQNKYWGNQALALILIAYALTRTIFPLAQEKK